MTTTASRGPAKGSTRTSGKGRRSAVDARARAYASTHNWILLLTGVLCGIGLAMVLSATQVSSLYDSGNAWAAAAKQAMWLGLGVVALVLARRIGYERLPRLAPLLLLIAFVTLVAVLIPGLGITVNGATRWIGVGQWRVQPSEFAKLAMVVFVAKVLVEKERQIDDWRATLRPIAIVFVAFAGLLMLEPNLGTTMILAAIVLAMMLVGGVPGLPLATFGAILVGAAVVFVRTVGFRMRRLLAFMDPWADPMNAGFQTIQSQIGFATGGLLGVGLGNGRAKWGFLPEASTDFIFAIIGEETGYLGVLVVITLILSFGLLGSRVALRAPDRLGTLLASGITVWILVQAFVNMGAAVGVLPITGVPLPFISAGGSSLVFTMAAVGVLLDIARRSR